MISLTKNKNNFLENYPKYYIKILNTSFCNYFVYFVLLIEV